MIKRQLVQGFVLTWGILGALTNVAWAGESTFHLDDSSSATFQAVGNPGFLRINGEGGKPRGEITFSDPGHLRHADIKVTLLDLVTGIDRRDEHMREKYLEIGKFPETELKVDNLTLHDGKASGDLKTKGSLTLHGVTKDVALEFTNLKEREGAIDGDLAFEVVLKEFGIAIPSFMGVTVADIVKVQANFHAVRAQP